jgi:hypothetical protein
MCVDDQGRQYDNWEVGGVSLGWGKGGYGISPEDCARDCAEIDTCVGI